MLKKIIIESDKYDLFYNLAFEEYALNNLTDKFSILFLWQSLRAVVIGRFQNPYKECAVETLMKNNIQLGRRITGGGTVYHDAGNLNYSFISKKESFDQQENFNIIQRALKNLNIEPALSSNKDLMVRNKKISGNAFGYKKNGAIHHGTLLVDSNINDIIFFLKRPEYEIIDHSISSHPASVQNLSALNKNIDIISLKREIACNFVEDKMDWRIINPDEVIDQKEFIKYYDKMKSKDWIFGFPEKFSILIKEDL